MLKYFRRFFLYFFIVLLICMFPLNTSYSYMFKTAFSDTKNKMFYLFTSLSLFILPVILIIDLTIRTNQMNYEIGRTGKKLNFYYMFKNEFIGALFVDLMRPVLSIISIFRMLIKGFYEKELGILGNICIFLQPILDLFIFVYVTVVSVPGILELIYKQ